MSKFDAPELTDYEKAEAAVATGFIVTRLRPDTMTGMGPLAVFNAIFQPHYEYDKVQFTKPRTRTSVPYKREYQINLQGVFAVLTSPILREYLKKKTSIFI